MHPFFPQFIPFFQACLELVHIVTPLPGRNRFEALQAGVEQETCSAGIHSVNVFVLPADIVCVGIDKYRFQKILC